MARQPGTKKGIFVLFGLGLMLMLLLACTSGEDQVANAGRQNNGPSTQSGVAGAVPQANNAILELTELRARTLSASAALDVPAAARQGIQVSGRGEASAAADLAILNLGVQTLADTVAEAREQAGVAMGRVIEVLKAKNIEDRDIQTSHFNINPRYTSREVTRCPGRLDTGVRQVEPVKVPNVSTRVESGREISLEPGVEIARSPQKPECFKERERVIIGYEVSNQLTVKLRDLDEAGSVIDEVTAAGGDLIRFNGINFTIDDTDALQDQARSAAISDMMDKANQVANLTGVELGKLIHISETGGQPRVAFESLERLSFATAAKSAPTPIMGGELEVTVTVQALYAIK